VNTYESWRITFQSSEQAARAAYSKVEELSKQLAALRDQEPAATESVNARILEALKKCRDQFQCYVGHHLEKGSYDKAASNEAFVGMADSAIAAAESQEAWKVGPAHRLTDEEIESIWVEHGLDDCAVHEFARAIESALLGDKPQPADCTKEDRQ